MQSMVHVATFSRKGEYLAVGLRTGETYIYDVKTFSYRILTEVQHYAEDHPGIWNVQFSPDDKYIATGAHNGQIRIWNFAERRVLATFKKLATIVSLEFSPNGRFLLSSSSDNNTWVDIWCIRDGSSRKLLDTASRSPVCSVAISLDGRCVAAGDYHAMVRIWDFRSGQVLRRWKASELSYLQSMVFIQDGKGLLSGGDGILRFWDISSLGSRRGELVSGSIDKEMTFQGHTEHIFSISLLPDSPWIFSGSGDSTVRIWDALTGAWRCTLGGHQGFINSVSASPDGQHLASSSPDGLVRVWRYEEVE